MFSHPDCQLLDCIQLAYTAALPTPKNVRVEKSGVESDLWSVFGA